MDFSSRGFFEKLSGSEYPTHRKLEEAILALFNEHLVNLPPRYSYRDLIEWGERNNCITQIKGTTFRIEVPKTQAMDARAGFPKA